MGVYVMDDTDINELHARFIMTNSFFLGSDLLNNLFNLLDALDPFERHPMLHGWMYSALTIADRNGEPTEEEAMEAEYGMFKAKCIALQEQGLTDFFLV